MPCRINKTQSWVVRLELEKTSHKKWSFVTLTYDDEHLPSDQGLHKRDLQLFFKRLRKSGLVFKYYAVGEYGEKELKYFDPLDKELIDLGKIKMHGRPHFHILFFGLDFKSDDDFNILVRCWSYCSSDYWIIHRAKLIGSVESSSIRYVCDYMQKKQYGLNSVVEYFNSQPPFSLCSQKLGLSAFSDNLDNYKYNGFIMYNGHRVPIPRYFREKFGILPIYEISEKNFYRQFCIQKGLVKPEELDKYDKLSKLHGTNEYFHLVHDKYSDRFEEVQKLLKKRNFLYSRSNLL